MPQSPNKTLTLQEVASSLYSRHLFKGDVQQVYVDNGDAISYRDIVELYLRLSGNTGWTWRDAKGRILSPISPIGNILNILRDLCLWPFFYLKHSIAVSFLGKTAPRTTLKKEPVLFLRTDHWFNVKSGGSVGHLSGVIHGLRGVGYKTHVVSTDRLVGVEENGHFHLCMPIYGKGRNIPNMPELLYNDQLFDFVSKNLPNWAPSFIYQRYSLGNYAGAALKKHYGIPYVCEYNGSFPWMARHWDGRRLFHESLLALIELLNLKAADLIVVVSQSMKDELVGRGMEAGKIVVNPNGVDPETYSPDVDGSGIRGVHNLGGKTVIGFIGTFGRWHGAEMLAEAFGRLMQDFPQYRNNVCLLMIGDGITMPQVKENLERYGVTDISILTGLVPQEDGPKYLAACDILASPHVPNPDGTPFFGSPTKLFEYMAMGKGIVASDLDQIGEILEHNRTAWMVKPGDVESLMLGLKALIDGVDLRNRLGLAAREEAIAKYTWAKHVEKIISALEKGTCKERV